jgi:hypothetical protein
LVRLASKRAVSWSYSDCRVATCSTLPGSDTLCHECKEILPSCLAECPRDVCSEGH